MPFSRRLAYVTPAFLRPTLGWSIAGVFTVLAGLLFLLDEFGPKDRPRMIDALSWLPWWGWLILALITAWLALFEGGYRTWDEAVKSGKAALADKEAQLSSALAAKDAELSLRDAEIARLNQALERAEALPRQRLAGAEMDARIELAGLITRFHRHTVGWDKVRPDDADLSRAGALKDQLSKHPEAASLWKDFFGAIAVYQSQSWVKRLAPEEVTAEEVERLFLEGDRDAVPVTEAAEAYRDWLLMRD